MNIRKDSAGYVTGEHILKSGFKIDKEYECKEWYKKDYSKDGKLFLTGGYWTYYIRDKNGKKLFEGWWNSNEEFDKTISEIESKL
jgi:hypothetical protein